MNDAPLRQLRQCADDHADALLGHDERPPRHLIDLLVATLLDEPLDPKIEGAHRHAREGYPDQGRKPFFAYEKFHPRPLTVGAAPFTLAQRRKGELKHSQWTARVSAPLEPAPCHG
jgi:hypothetical protein